MEISAVLTSFDGAAFVYFPDTKLLRTVGKRCVVLQPLFVYRTFHVFTTFVALNLLVNITRLHYWENIFDRLGSQTLLTVLLFQQFQEG